MDKICAGGTPNQKTPDNSKSAPANATVTKTTHVQKMSQVLQHK